MRRSTFKSLFYFKSCSCEQIGCIERARALAVCLGATNRAQRDFCSLAPKSSAAASDSTRQNARERRLISVCNNR